MENVSGIIGLVFAFITVALTIVALITFRKERRLTRLSTFISLLLSLAMLPLFTALSGAQLNPLLGWPLLVLGLLVGLIWGRSTRLYYRDEKVMGKRSLFHLVGWGLSWALSQFLALFDSALLAALGLVPIFFTTGTQVGTQANLLFRLLFLKKTSGPDTPLPQ
jgi:hypothetical protein